MLIEKARGLEIEDLRPDLQRILISAQELLELVDRLLDVDGVASPPARRASVGKKFMIENMAYVDRGRI
jgi:hypothetical protein